MKFKLFGCQITISSASSKHEEPIDIFDGPIQRQSKAYHAADQMDMNLAHAAYKERRENESNYERGWSEAHELMDQDRNPNDVYRMYVVGDPQNAMYTKGWHAACLERGAIKTN